MTRKKNWFFDFVSDDSKFITVFHISSTTGHKKRYSLSNRNPELLAGSVLNVTEVPNSSSLTKCEIPIGVSQFSFNI